MQVDAAPAMAPSLHIIISMIPSLTTLKISQLASVCQTRRRRRKQLRERENGGMDGNRKHASGEAKGKEGGNMPSEWRESRRQSGRATMSEETAEAMSSDARRLEANLRTR